MVPTVLVVGSVNMDLVAAVDRVPKAGENVRGSDLRTIPGGKGANQAVAAARLGARTRLLARVGGDGFGDRLRAGLDEAGVDTDLVRPVQGCPSGIALVLVDASGQNTIVVTAGANGRLSPEDLEAARPAFGRVDAVVVQLEVPPETVARTVELGREAGARTVVDAGPPRRAGDQAVFGCSVLTPNEAEAAALLDLDPAGADPAAMARRLLQRGPEAVVIKAGDRGAFVAVEGRVEHVPAFAVRPVDTTAAGDAFTAALAVECVKGTDLVTAVRVANAAGALACLKLGAQPSMPTADEVAAFLEREA